MARRYLIGSLIALAIWIVLLLTVRPCYSAPGNSFAPLPQAGNLILVDSVFGSDVEGGRGSYSTPFKTFAAALSKAQAGDTIKLGPGTFPLPNVVGGTASQSNFVTLPAFVHIEGAGRRKTTILSGNNLITEGWIGVNNGCSIKDLTLTKLDTNYYKAYPIVTGIGLSSATNVLLQNVEIIADSDCLGLNNNTRLTAVNCRFDTRWDTAVTVGGVGADGSGLYQFLDCEVYAHQDAEANTRSSGALNGINIGDGYVYITGGNTVLSNIIAATVAIAVGGALDVNHFFVSGHPITILNDNSGGTAYYANLVSVFGHPYPDLKCPTPMAFIGDTAVLYKSFLAADATSVTATFANSLLSVNVVAGHKYAITCSLFFNESTAADGAKIDFNGGAATATNFRGDNEVWDASTQSHTPSTSALSTSLGVGSFTGLGTFLFHGAFEPATSGTFILRFAQFSHSTGTLTLQRGSWLELIDTTD